MQAIMQHINRQLSWVRRLSTTSSSYYHSYRGTWNKCNRVQNPNIVEQMATLGDMKANSVKRTKMILMCGFGSTGALGLSRFYQPEKTRLDQLVSKDTSLSTFKLLALNMESIEDIACGYGFTIVAGKLNNSSHSAVGFGLNSFSQIGYQAVRPGFALEVVINPSPITLPTKSSVRAVSCGRSHSLLLDKAGQVFALGNNSLGQCGRLINEKEQYFGQKKVNVVQNLPPNISQVVCGQDHSMFLTDTGALYSCGWSADGQTGLGSYDTQQIVGQVQGDLQGVKVVKVSASADTVMALDNEGNVFGWGNSEYSQFKVLASDASEQFNSPKHLNLSGVPGKIIDVAAGGTMCAVVNDRGQVYVWGYGLLGMGPNVDQLEIPTLLPETLFGMNAYNQDTKVTKIYAGLSQFAAITNKGDLFAWGKNRGCSLGFQHKRPQYFPMHVPTLLSAVTKVAMGIDHSGVLVEKVC